jgi:cysteine desulfurase/selenocysteine lyase
MTTPFEALRATAIGIDTTITVTDLQGRERRAQTRYLDSAATCLQIRPVSDAMFEYLSTSCANSHTHATATGRDTTTAIEHAHEDIMALLGADPATDCAIFMGSGTTQAMCFLADAISYRTHKTSKRYAVVSSLEHHSNLIPWQRRFEMLYVNANLDGTLDMKHLRELIRKHAGQIAVVAVTAVSNVTGVTPPLGDIARLAHAAGAPLCVDAAQGAAHIPISKASIGIDFLVGSGHKMYAPGSPGWLIGPRAYFTALGPTVGALGGGSVERVTLEHTEFKTDPTARYEAGTPNIPGVVGLGTAARVLNRIGMQAVLEHERTIVAETLRQMQTVPGLVVYGPLDPTQKTALVAFNIDDIPHGLVSAVLNDLFAIQTRHDCFCAQPYVRQQIAAACEARGFCKPVFAGKTGMVRASFGVYSDLSDVAALVAALTWVAGHRAQLEPLYRETDGSWEHVSFRSTTGFDYRRFADR